MENKTVDVLKGTYFSAKQELSSCSGTRGKNLTGNSWSQTAKSFLEIASKKTKHVFYPS